MPAASRKPAEIGRTQAERRLEAETKIVQAAFDIVARRGVDQVTLAEAGEEAGYSRALPAHYFESREALPAAVAEHAVEKYRLRLIDATRPGRTGLESVLATIAFYFDETRGGRSAARVLRGDERRPALAVDRARPWRGSTRTWIERIAAPHPLRPTAG